jgi:hypothetical protein
MLSLLVAIFVLMFTFEMRTVPYKINLFNDNAYTNGDHIYMKRKEGEREQDSRETEGEDVRETEGGSEWR